MRFQIAFESGDITARQFSKLLHVFCKTIKLGINDRVRTIGRHYIPIPIAVTNDLVILQRIKRCFSCGNGFNVEPFKQRAGTIRVLRQTGINMIVNLTARLSIQWRVNSENMFETVVEPKCRRGAPKQMVIFCKQVPNLFWIAVLR